MTAGPALVDSSAWIPLFRRNHPAGPKLRARISQLQASGQAATTEPIMLELLRGARDTADYEQLAALLGDLTLLPVSLERWQEAAQMGFDLLRRHGITVPSVDLLIAAVAKAHGATLVHRDGDFDLIAKHVPLTVESHV